MEEETLTEKYSHCTAENFKSDLSELCDKCPLPEMIIPKIQQQIIFQAKQQKEILTESQFNDYCSEEIKSAQKVMMETSLFVQQDKDDSRFRSSRILVYIWNKERIKALNSLIPDSTSHTESTTTAKEVNVEIEIPGFDDPAKLQRGVTELVNKWQMQKGNPVPYKHPFLWHTKFRHGSSSPYVLEVNKDEVITDENGLVVDHTRVPLSDEDINEAFIHYITTCSIIQIAPFLTYQFEKFYNGLRADESAQPFFEYIIGLADIANARGLLYKAEANAFVQWIATNPHYQHSVNDSSPDRLYTPFTESPRNIFNTMPLEEVTRWFMKLSEANSKNGRPFLSAQQVNEFIGRAFEGKTFTEKLSLNTKPGDKGIIIGLFHLYYSHCVYHQPKTGKIDPAASKEKYVRLLTDNFDNWSYDEVKHNFRRGGSWSNKP